MKDAVIAALVLALAGCSFTRLPETAASDAPLEAITDCTPGASVCRDRDLEVCNAEGTGLDPARKVTCALGCVEDSRCVEASNIPVDVQLACTGSAPALEPPAGATVTIGPTAIACAPSCGDTGAIDPVRTLAQPDGPALTVYCLSRVALADDVELVVDPAMHDAIAWFVAGSVDIAGDIVVRGGDATVLAPGAAGPGGGAGGTMPSNGNDGDPGQPAASCGGRGGKSEGTTSAAGGGGGGGGHLAAGGVGGQGRAPQNGTTAAGGAAGGTCGAEALSPLAGGGGGAAGGDATCGVDCGWGGGGGGGAFQIAAVGVITLADGGELHASGGSGFGSTQGQLAAGGGGGGGAGGALLLEAKELRLRGILRVAGGTGGTTGAGAGGTGANQSTLTGGTGASQDNAGEGGAGGGGGAGRVRLHSLAPVCAAAQIAPAGTCSDAGLRSTSQ